MIEGVADPALAGACDLPGGGHQTPGTEIGRLQVAGPNYDEPANRRAVGEGTTAGAQRHPHHLELGVALKVLRLHQCANPSDALSRVLADGCGHGWRQTTVADGTAAGADISGTATDQQGQGAEGNGNDHAHHRPHSDDRISGKLRQPQFRHQAQVGAGENVSPSH